MPIIHVHLLEGRSKQLKQQLIAEVTSAVSKTLGNSPESVRVLLHEVPEENWGVAGSSISQRKRES